MGLLARTLKAHNAAAQSAPDGPARQRQGLRQRAGAFARNPAPPAAKISEPEAAPGASRDCARTGGAPRGKTQGLRRKAERMRALLANAAPAPQKSGLAKRALAYREQTGGLKE